MKPAEHYYQAVKVAEEILDTKLQEAFKEIYEKTGSTPLVVAVEIQPRRTVGERHPQGIFAGSRVSFIQD